MKFKNILKEAYIDTLPLSKIDKHILTQMNNDNVLELDEIGKFKYLNDLTNKLAIGLDKVVSLYMTYKKYKDLLFSEKGIEIVTTYDIFTDELYELTRYKLLQFFINNYNDKIVYENNGISSRILIHEDLETMFEEEMSPEIYVNMGVSGEYEGTVIYGSRKGETYKTTDVEFYGSIFLSILPKTATNNLHYDFINFSEESFGDWMMVHKKREHSDMIDGGKIKGSFIKPPKNYSDEELKKYCDQWIEIGKKIIGKNIHLLLEYKDFVEHGGIFEGYNKK